MVTCHGTTATRLCPRVDKHRACRHLLAVETVRVRPIVRGLTGFVVMIGITGAAVCGVPVALDGVSMVVALVALRAELTGEGVWCGVVPVAVGPAFARCCIRATLLVYHLRNDRGSGRGGREDA
jgi:hypothetical protein